MRGLCLSQASSQALAYSFFTVNGSLDPACLGNRYDGPCKMKHLLFANIASTNLERIFAHTKLSQRVRWLQIASEEDADQPMTFSCRRRDKPEFVGRGPGRK